MGVTDTRVCIKGNNDSRGKRRERTCTHVVIMSNASSTDKDSAVFEREIIDPDTRCISRIEETILGTVSVGAGIFLCNSGDRDTKDDKRVY
jgi:hypothetical protein